MEASTTDTSRLITIKIALYPKGDPLAILQVDPDTPAAAFKALAEEHLRAEADVAERVDDDTDSPPTEEVVGNKRARAGKHPVDAAIASATAQCEQIAHLLQPTPRARRPSSASFVITQWYVAVRRLKSGQMEFRELPMVGDDNDKELSIKGLGIADGSVLFVALLLADPRAVGGALQLLLKQQEAHLALLQEIKDSDRAVAEALKSLSYQKESPIYVLDDVLRNKSYRGTAAAMAVISACGINRVSKRHEKEWDVREGVDRGWTPIMVAIGAGRTDVVRELLERGADLTIKSECCLYTPLHHAVSSGEIAAVRMIASRMDPRAIDRLTDYEGHTALHVAVDYDYPEAIKILVEHGCDINVLDQSSSTGTPLHLAASLGRKEAAKVLVAYGANVQATDKKGVTPFRKAKNSKAIMKILVDAGAYK